MATNPDMMMDPSAESAPAITERRLGQLPLSTLGTLKTRVQSTKATCTITQYDLATVHSRYECQLPHSYSSEFSDAISSIYQGTFQIFKELYGQTTHSIGATTELSSASWELNVDGTSTSIKLHPYSDDVSMSYWSAIASGPAAETAIQSIQSCIETIAELVTSKSQLSTMESAIDGSCKLTKLSKTKYDLKCYPLTFVASTGVIGGFSTIMSSFSNAI